MMRLALVTIAHAQLVVDWTAKSTFENGAALKARCALYTTVTFHRTCLPNANQRYWRKPKDCRPVVRFDEIASDFGLGPSEDKAMNNWRRCDLNRSRPVRMHTDGLHAITVVDCVAGFYASSSRDGCRGGLRLQVLPSTQFFRLHSLSDGSVDVYDASGSRFFDQILQALPAADRTLRPSRNMAAWVADPIVRWLGDCLSAGSTIEACDDLAKALGSRLADFRAAIARAGPSRKRLATVVDRIAWAFRADDLEHEWPRYAGLFNTTAPVPPISDSLADASSLSPSARSALRGYLREDYDAVRELERRGVLAKRPPEKKINFLHIPKTGGTGLELLSKSFGHACGVWGSHMVAFDHERPWSPYWLQELWSGPADAGREVSKTRTARTTFSLLMAEWHTPIRFLDDYRRAQLYPYAETFCVLREPTQHLASVAGYHMGPDSMIPMRLNAWILDKFHKYERGQWDGLGGHLWPQTYFTRDCDVVLRYESLAADLNALTKRVGCAVKAPANFVKPPGWGSARGDLAPSLSYEVLAKAKVIYREDYLLYERLRRMDVETVVRAVVGTIYSD